VVPPRRRLLLLRLPALVRLGQAVAEPGVGPRVLIDDLAAIPWTGRPVFICFDSDAADNPDVRKAERHLARELDKAGATVKVVRLPDDGPDKVGLDDYLLTHTAADLQGLIAAAVEPDLLAEPAAAAPVTDPHRQADAYLRKRWGQGDRLALRYWDGRWWQWRERAYVEAKESDIRPGLTQSIKEEFDRDHADRTRWYESQRECVEAEMSGTDSPAKKRRLEREAPKPPTRLPVTRKTVGDTLGALERLAAVPAGTTPPGTALGRDGAGRRPYRPGDRHQRGTPGLPSGNAAVSVLPLSRRRLARLPTYSRDDPTQLIGPLPAEFHVLADVLANDHLGQGSRLDAQQVAGQLQAGPARVGQADGEGRPAGVRAHWSARHGAGLRLVLWAEGPLQQLPDDDAQADAPSGTDLLDAVGQRLRQK
jgi:Domain of unknown function (DUF3854)